MATGLNESPISELTNRDEKARLQAIKTVIVTGTLFILFIVYLCVGAAIFVAIEGTEPDDTEPTQREEMTRELLIDKLIELGNDINATKQEYEDALDRYEDIYDEYYEYWHQWSYEMSLFYCFKLLTTIGYGSIVPVTTGGQLLSIVYAFFGIILLLTLLVNTGSVLAQELNSRYNIIRMHLAKRTGVAYKRENFADDQLPADDDTEEDCRIDSVAEEESLMYNDQIPFWALTVFSFVFLLIFSAIIYALEDWTYIESLYFSFMSLATIGFGDILPEKNLVGCTILIANGLIVVAIIICLCQTRIIHVIDSIERLVEKVALRWVQ